MEHLIKHQRGYLLIWATILIIIAAFVGNLLVSMFMGKTTAVQNDVTSNTALYLATSGLEITKRDVILNQISCNNINGTSKYTNAALFNGKFTVTGTNNAASASLSSSIDNTTTSIALTSSSGFTSSGIIMIDNELIAYASISGNTLLNAIRGMAGTTATTHAANTAIIQNQCVLTATGGIPTLTTPNGKRIVQQTLFGYNSFTTTTGSIPALVSTGPVTMSGGNFINNPSVTTSSPGFPGSNIVTSGSVSISGNSATQVSNGSGGLVASSTNKGLAGDVIQNYAGIDSSNLFTVVFQTSKAEMQARADVVFNSTINDLMLLSGYNAKIIWVNGDVNVQGNRAASIGTPSKPVILVINGNVSTGGSAVLTVYGILYVTGTMTDNGNGVVINGQLATEQKTIFTGGSIVATLNPVILAALGTQYMMPTNYNNNYIGYLTEVLP